MIPLYLTHYSLDSGLLRNPIFGFNLFAFLNVFLIILQAGEEICASMGMRFDLRFPMVLHYMVLIPTFEPLGAALAMTMGAWIVVTGAIVYYRFRLMFMQPMLINVGIATGLVGAAVTQLFITAPLLLLQCIGLIMLYAFTLAMSDNPTSEGLQSFALWQQGLPQS